MKNKHTLKSFLLSAVSILLLACAPKEPAVTYQTLDFTQDGQSFSIVQFYRQMPVYIAKVKENRKGIERIYRALVYQPIWEDFASKGECSFLAKSLETPITDLAALHTEIEVLSQSGVEEIIQKALLKVSKVLPGPNTTVYLQVMDPIYKQYIPENLQIGAVAYTFGSGRIFIAIDPTTADWKNQLPKVVAHEYHHSIWLSRNFKTIHFSLIEYLCLEGSAVSFAERVYPDIKSSWIDIFGFEKEKDVWNRIKNSLHSRDADLNRRMSVGDKDIPMASVYTIGYRIMKEFFKNNPQVPLLEWTDMPAEEILAKSHYDKKFN